MFCRKKDEEIKRLKEEIRDLKLKLFNNANHPKFNSGDIVSCEHPKTGDTIRMYVLGEPTIEIDGNPKYVYDLITTDFKQRYTCSGSILTLVKNK